MISLQNRLFLEQFLPMLKAGIKKRISVKIMDHDKGQSLQVYLPIYGVLSFISSGKFPSIAKYFRPVLKNFLLITISGKSL